ncbi:MAG: FAD:protein FMN transferase, partial [Acidobacteriota bacterium]
MTIAPRILSTLMVLAVASLAAFSAPGRVTRERFLMGTRCEATVAWAPGSGIGREEAAEAIEAAFDEIARLEAILSDYRPDSELSRLNRQATAAPFACSDDLYGFLARSVELARRSHGAVDITVAPLVQVWDLRGEGRRASAAEIERAREKVGYRLLRMDPTHRSVRFRVAGMGLDPGALGKGFALDAAARILRGRGVTSALLDFGGQILAIGSPPGQEAWQVGVAHPLRRDEQLLALRLRDASVATSGNAERGIMAGGVRLGHVVDPRTGLTVDTDASAVVIAPTATLADAASTAVLVMGPREGLLWAESQPDLSALYLAAGADGAVERRATPGFELAYLPPGADGVAGGAETGGREEEPDRRIADLERRVRELEASLEKTQEASPSAAELQRRIDVLAEELERNRAGQPQKPGGLRSVHGL